MYLKTTRSVHANQFWYYSGQIQLDTVVRRLQVIALYLRPVRKFAKQKRLQFTTAMSSPEDSKSFDKIPPQVLKQRYEEQATLSPARGIHRDQPWDRLEAIYRSPSFHGLESDLHRFLEIAGRVGDKLDCLHDYLKWNVSFLACHSVREIFYFTVQ